ncbi:MAG: cytochrome c [Bacteroidales bacterium]|nr:cytochrome c [Bacteroidales bacterium]
MKKPDNHLLLLLFVTLFLFKPVLGQDAGEKLFKKNNCHTCHTINKGPLVGPDLKNITTKRDEDWLIEFIKSPQRMINNKDSIAVALYEKYNKVMMPNNELSDEEIKSILKYIENFEDTPSKEVAKDTASDTTGGITKPLFSSNNIETGKILFTGQVGFFNNGPSCISCHNVNTQPGLMGGNMAKDLSKSFANMGEAGIKAILKNPPFPVMKEAYKKSPLMESEIHNLTAYLEFASRKTTNKKANTGIGLAYKLLIAGMAGAGFILLALRLIWPDRHEKTINHTIYSRQLKTE